MNLYDNTDYMEDVRRTAQLDLPWDRLKDKAVLISGATGLVGSFLIDVLMERNEQFSMNCGIYALGRSEEKAKARFGARSCDPLWDEAKRRQRQGSAREAAIRCFLLFLMTSIFLSSGMI